MALLILSGDLDEAREAAVLVERTSMRPIGGLFDDARDAAAFLVWCADGGLHYRQSDRLEQGRLERIWRAERQWPRCREDDCPGRAQPGRLVCADCEGAALGAIEAMIVRAVGEAP